MASENEYKRRIDKYDLARLLHLWEAVKAGNTPDWEPGKAFEYLVLRAFQLEGADIRWPYMVKIHDVQIEQIDGVVYSDGLACLVECKDHEQPVAYAPIARLRSQLLRRPAGAIGIVFSGRSEFTDPALTLTRFTAPQTILLWRPDDVDYVLSQRRMRRALIEKYRHCVENGVPDYNVRSEEVP